MSFVESLAVIRFLSGEESRGEAQLKIASLGHLLLKVTPLVEAFLPWGVVLNFRGFKCSPREMLSRTLRVLQGHTDTLIIVGGVHKDFCKARMEWRYGTSFMPNEPTSAPHVEWWSYDMMMAHYQKIPVRYLVKMTSANPTLEACDVFVWGDVLKVKSTQKRKHLAQHLLSWCACFPEIQYGWDVLVPPVSLAVSQEFEPPLRRQDALLFLLQPLSERLCAVLDSRGLGLIKMAIKLKFSWSPTERLDVFETLQQRKREWSQEVTFQVPMAEPKPLSSIVLKSLSAIERTYELHHLSLEAVQTTPMEIHQGGLWGQDETMLKMPLWLEEMQHLFGMHQIGFLTPTPYRAPWNSYVVGHSRGLSNTSDKASELVQHDLPLRWLKEKKAISNSCLSDLSPYFTFQEEPTLLDSLGITYYRAWLSDERQVLCQHELEEDQWWLYAFFD